VPEVVEPGPRRVQRYRLEERLDGAGRRTGTADPGSPATSGGLPAGTTYWRAEDELLARPVSVCLIDLAGSAGNGESPADAVLAAARRAAALPDPRFLRVLDASQLDGHVYVVSEWVAATDLAGLVADGPLPAGEARALAADLAAAISAAHTAGLAHLCLTPEHVLRTAHGQLKVAGLAVDAAARGLRAADQAEAAERDVRGIGAVLYAALTARWPGDLPSTLPPAPLADDAACSPRQVRAGVPHDLDEITCRALCLPARRAESIATPADLGAALASAGHTTRMPAVGRSDVPASRTGPPGEDEYRAEEDRDAPSEGRARSRAVTLAWVAAAIVLVTGLSLFGGQVVMTALDGDDNGGPAAADGGSDGDTDATGAPLRRLEVAGVQTFDPAPGDGEEHDELAPLAVDRDPATAWTTVNYYDPIHFLKDGVGLVLDLGAPVDVSEVVIRAEGGPTDVEVRVAERRPTTLRGYAEFDRTSNATGATALRVAEPARARFVLVWLTDLPKVGGNYVGEISEITVRGVPAG